MSEQDIFDSKTIRQAEQSGPQQPNSLLDELGLPPKIISFIRKNTKNIQIGVVFIVVLVVGWSVLDYYMENNRSESATMLSEAMVEEDDVFRGELLAGVIGSYSSTDAAVWARIEQSHISFRAGDYGDAIEKYEAILGDLSTGSPLIPIVQYSAAVACENQGELDKALEYYGEIALIKGFAAQGYAAQGRVYEKKGNTVKAIEAYGKAGEIAGSGQALVKYRLKSLQVAEGNEGQGVTEN